MLYIYKIYKNTTEVSQGKKERRQNEKSRTHLKAFDQTFFPHLLSNMNFYYSHCYKFN